MDFNKPGTTAALGRARPGAAYSAIVGTLARASLPTPLRGLAYRAFARAVGANLAETELDLAAYPSLGDFFARRLKDGARTVDRTPGAIVSPCDGVLAARGTALDGSMVQAKGLDYFLHDLVADDALARSLSGGEYATIYLSPKDYHRVHTPLAGRITRYDYLPGTLWPVNQWATARREGLLVKNERVVIHLNADGIGPVAVVMVGAVGVGNSVLTEAPESREFRGSSERRVIELDRRVERGDELGAFHLGSTVVLVFPPGKAELTGDVGAKLLFGERIGAVPGGRA